MIMNNFKLLTQKTINLKNCKIIIKLSKILMIRIKMKIKVSFRIMKKIYQGNKMNQQEYFSAKKTLSQR